MNLSVVFLVSVAAAAAVEGAITAAPRTLRRNGQPLSAAAPRDDCRGQTRRCTDCSTLLVCATIGTVLVPLQSLACPAATPYCSGGACVASIQDSGCSAPPAADPAFTCTGNGYFPSPSDCAKYYLCADGLAYEYDCSAYPGTVYSHEKALCVPSAEAVCAPAVCNSSTLLVYQRWPGGASVFFLCVDERPEHAYVADCGADSAISPDGVCSLACLREGRLPDASRPQGYFECVRTAGGFGSPVPATCPPGTAFHAASQRCVGAATNDDDGDHPEEDLYAPSASESESLYMLPAFYRIGVASAAHQIEGAWSEEWRSATVWNVGDVAHDVQLLKELGVNMYRFPLAWSRLLPRGSQEEGYDAEALDYYNNLIDELIANNIEPVVTIHHRDIPQMYLDDGGWFTEAIQDRFVDFADLAFMSFGDRVKMWVLLDSPQAHCMEAYEGVESAPGLGLEGTGGYGCVHNMILAHAMAYHLYNNTYKMIQGGKVGSALDLQFQMPASNSREDAEAAERANVFTFAWFADPVMVGDYPAAMRDVVDRNSFGNGLAASRLPVFTAAEKALISGTMDFIGLNHYTTSLTRPGTAAGLVASIYNDTNAVSHSRASWLRTARDGFVVAPWGFRAALNWIKDRFNNFPVLVTANGYFGRRDEECHDPDREGYHSVYMRALARAVNEDACNVVGYMAWSLKDGYNLKTGLAYVNLSDPERPGTLKQSARFIQDVTRTMYARYVQPV